jgi:hypothetical protein
VQVALIDSLVIPLIVAADKAGTVRQLLAPELLEAFMDAIFRSSASFRLGECGLLFPFFWADYVTRLRCDRFPPKTFSPPPARPHKKTIEPKPGEALRIRLLHLSVELLKAGREAVAANKALRDALTKWTWRFLVVPEECPCRCVVFLDGVFARGWPCFVQRKCNCLLRFVDPEGARAEVVGIVFLCAGLLWQAFFWCFFFCVLSLSL